MCRLVWQVWLARPPNPVLPQVNSKASSSMCAGHTGGSADGAALQHASPQPLPPHDLCSGALRLHKPCRVPSGSLGQAVSFLMHAHVAHASVPCLLRPLLVLACGPPLAACLLLFFATWPCMPPLIAAGIGTSVALCFTLCFTDLTVKHRWHTE